MQLILTKGQSKGLMGGVSFEVRAQVQLSEEERRLIQYYKLENDILFSKHLTLFGKPMEQMVHIRVKNLLNGDSFKCKDLSELIAYSDSLKSACAKLKTYIEVASTFGGQEVIDFDRPVDISDSESEEE
jgi:hypothetical protein